MKNLRDKVVVITGASSGIGCAAALAFARRGSNIVLAARRVGRLEEVKTEVEKLGAKALVVPTDVTVPEHTQRLIDASIEHFGQIDVIINNAGVGLVGAFTETPFEETRKLFEVNFFGALKVMQIGLKTMERQGWGVVINVASLAGLFPTAYVSVYNSTKAALILLSESTNIEYIGTRIKVVAFCPGVTETEFFATGKGFGRFKKWVPTERPISAEVVAERLVRTALKPKPLVTISAFAKLGQIAKALLPSTYYAVVKTFRNRMQQANPPEDNNAQ
jgi:short-subunit dehydrogenase